jgi:hypothetical protein
MRASPRDETFVQVRRGSAAVDLVVPVCMAPGFPRGELTWKGPVRPLCAPSSPVPCATLDSPVKGDVCPDARPPNGLDAGQSPFATPVDPGVNHPSGYFVGIS